MKQFIKKDNPCKFKKCFRMMKISIFLMFLSIGVASASSTYSQNAMLSLKVQNKTLKDVFRDIESQSEYIFFYNDEAVNVNKRVDVSVNEATIYEVLDQVLDKKQSSYKVVDRQVILFKNVVAPNPESEVVKEDQQTYTTTGVVKSNTGEPLIGVSVIEKGTTNGVLTDIDGTFTIKTASNNVTLVFSYIGFESTEIQTNGRQKIDVILQEKASDLDEVIVVAYGTQKKSSVTGAISVVNADKLKTVTTPNVNAMLQGKVAGVQVLNKSGKPGEAADIKIRGKGTLNANTNPLWVIDGVVSGTGASLNPNEIETISVLKDGAATALYGSRATNGVILVTTKSGRMGENKVDVSVKLGINNHNLGKFKLMNGQELYNYANSMPGIKNVFPKFSEDLLKHDTDWYDLASQTGFTQNYTVSYTGGGDKVRSFVSADYYGEEGAVKGYKYDRFNVRSNNDYKISDKLTLKTKIAGSYSTVDDKIHSVQSAMNYLPWDYPYNEDGSIRTGKEADWYGRDKSNYLYNRKLDWGKSKTLGVTATIGAEYRITDYLTFESTNNIGYTYKRSTNYEDPRSIGASEYSGSINSINEFTTTRYTNQLLRFNHIFNDIHAVSAFLGYEYSDYQYEKDDVTARGIPPGGEVLGVAANPYATKGEKRETAMQSVYFNANYTYNDKYMGQFSYRLDGSSQFGSDNRYGSFFTFGGAWSIHNENFMKDIEFINQLKLRASYGSVGNNPASSYDYMSLYSLSTHYNGIPAAFPEVLGNSDLSWEKCYETNIALDTRLFDRVNFSIDYYYKNTSDLLYAVPLTNITGYSSQWQNIGAVKNEGVEITLSPEIIKTKDFTWDMDFNIGINKSKIKELYEGKRQIDGNKVREEGDAMDTWFMYEWAGVDRYSGAPLWYMQNEDGTKTLTTDYAKASREKMGSSNPDFTGGIMTRLSYKGLSLSAAFSFVSGSKIYHYAREFYDNDGYYVTYNSMKLNDGWSRWENPGDIATHPQAIAGGNNNSNKPSSRYLEDASFFRMNNLTLSYSIPEKAIRKFGLKYANISLSGENLFCITNFSGVDPELGTGNANSTANPDVYPMARRFSLGINLTF